MCVLEWNHRKEYWYRRTRVIESSFKFKSNQWWTMELCVKNQEVVPQPAINSCLNLTKVSIQFQPLPSLLGRVAPNQPETFFFATLAAGHDDATQVPHSRGIFGPRERHRWPSCTGGKHSNPWCPGRVMTHIAPKINRNFTPSPRFQIL